MANTRITQGVIKPNEDYDVRHINATGIITATNINVSGVLTYEDVTNVDSIGVITARKGIVSSGVVTATAFHGDGSQLTGIDATALKDGGGNVKIQAQDSGAVHTGISTFDTINVGSGVTIESNGQATFTGIVTFGSNSTTIGDNVINVGTALTLGHTQGLQFHTQNLHSAGFEINQINASGIITASEFRGSGANLSNLPAGLGTALSQDQSSPLNKFYYTNTTLGVDSTITIDHPASSSAAYTQYGEIKVSDSADLIIAEGDDVIPDVLGLAEFGTIGGGASAGRMRVNTITNAEANGAPTVSNGLIISGVSTTSEIFVGNNIKLEPISGIVTATTFVGNLTGNVTGSGANLTNLPASQLTGTIADARISASSVTQHVTAFDDNNILNDISILALKVSALENSAASNTNSTYVDSFQDSAGISNFTTTGRSISGEYISSVYDAITNISAGWKGGQSNNTGTDANGATSYTGVDGVTRSKGQIVGNSYFPNYNGFCLGHIFGASDNFEVILVQKGEWQAGGRIHGSLGSNLSAIGTFRTEPPSSLGTTFTSHIGGLTMAGSYPMPDGNNFNGTMWYRYYRNNGTVTCTYTQSTSATYTFGATELAALRASTNYLGGGGSPFGSPTTINDKMLLIMGEAGTTQFIKIEMANTFAETVSATGSVTSVTINAPSTISKMGVIVTYIDHSGTATLNTDLKVFLSADNGSNFTQVTLAAMPLFATGVKMAKANDVTISNTGTQLKWKVEFANQASGSKETRVTGLSLQY